MEGNPHLAVMNLQRVGMAFDFIGRLYVANFECLGVPNLVAALDRLMQLPRFRSDRTPSSRRIHPPVASARFLYRQPSVGPGQGASL